MEILLDKDFGVCDEIAQGCGADFFFDG